VKYREGIHELLHERRKVSPTRWYLERQGKNAGVLLDKNKCMHDFRPRPYMSLQELQHIYNIYHDMGHDDIAQHTELQIASKRALDAKNCARRDELAANRVAGDERRAAKRKQDRREYVDEVKRARAAAPMQRDELCAQQKAFTEYGQMLNERAAAHTRKRIEKRQSRHGRVPVK
jgi:hypothetical protein